MTQNNVISANFQIPGFMSPSLKSAAKGNNAADDTFMNMLSERLAARSNGRAASTQRREPFMVKESTIKSEAREIQSPEKETKVKASQPKAVDTEETKVTKKAERAAVKEDRPKEEIEEEINTLEAMIALLEELMAKLDAISASADPVSLETAELILPTESESVSPMEILMALMEGNVEKLKKLMNELSDGQQTPEVNELLEKIRSLVEKLSEGEAKDLISKLSIELESIEPANGKILDQLKAKCGQLIENLKEQVSKLKEALPKDSEDQAHPVATIEGASLEEEKVEIVQDEEKELSNSKDTEKKTEVFEQSPDTHIINQDGTEDFDRFIIPNNQNTAEFVKEAVRAEKTPTIMSGRPLEQTVTNQVMMKVKLMAGENKQEMEMHLKPESLGKLSLKIIHERGEILAKITAENEQVKGILESNMQLLKDALEKNGLSVQSLSVSVGNGHGNNQSREDSGRSGKTAAGGFGHEKVNSTVKDTLEIRARIEKEYFNQSSQINLTA